MYGAKHDKVTMKKLVIDFSHPEEHDEDDITKFFYNYTILPTMDVETIGNGDISEFDITYDSFNSAKTTEFSPMQIDVQKLKRYFVPYIDMTHEKLNTTEPEY